MEANSDSAEISKYFIYFLSIFVVVLLIVLYLLGQANVRKGELADTDCYTRLNRVIQLHESGKWYDSVLTRSNAPFGEHLHWTRPLDVLLLTGAWIASPLTDFKTGLFWWGVLISPFFLAASVVFLPWAFRPLLGASTSNLISILFLFQVGTLGQYYIGRPDHHSMLGFIFIISTGIILRIIQGPFNKTICYFAGMIGALSMWIHIESMLLIFLSFLFLGIFWIIEDDDDFIHKNLHYAAALFVFTSLALILERPWYDLTSIEYDKISIVHWVIFGMINLFWVVVFYLRHHSVFSLQRRTMRFKIASVGVVIVTLCVWILFPGFYRGGYADIDPRIVPIWLNNVSEVLSPLRGEFLMPLISLIGSAIVGIVYICFIFRKRSYENLKGWIFILAGILLFASAGMFERRLLPYGNIITMVPLAALLGVVVQWESTHFSTIIKSFIRPFTIMAFGAGFLLIGYGCQNMIGTAPVTKKIDMIAPLSQMCDELNKLSPIHTQPIRIQAFIDYGPEILYRTSYEVIATPYHRNAQGILDDYWIMTAVSDEKARTLIHRRGINMILVSSKSTEKQYYTPVNKQSTFYERLTKDGGLDWIKEIPLPDPLSHSYRLFRVAG
ncbi:MAG: hypothetical protein CVU55_08790 [Deltaproteobacteria bacterium HGW-Deltaproteobacteria-13]|jgi:hypothetical protein|nr:MAG: hypothetical protein CVU55_08790 [Deltaproteobacteria bacterium HGW-Deltaproteobacteria-13]